MNNTVQAIDFHSHILPRADHGSDCTDTSLFQLSLLKKHGIDTVVATPHFYPENTSVDKFLERRKRSVERLLSKIDDLQLNVALGAEVLVCEGMEKMDGLELLTIEGTNTILLEMPFHEWSNEIIETVFKISKMDLKVVLAHIDRYPKAQVERLLEFEVNAQLNAKCLASIFTGGKYMEYFEQGKIVALGSDLHGRNEKKVKNLVTAYKKIGKTNREKVIASSAKLLDGAKFI